MAPSPKAASARASFGWRLSVRALGGRLGAQWERERRDTLFLMGALALVILPHIAHLPAWCSVAFFLLFCWRLGLVFSGRWLPRKAVRIATALAATLGVYAQYRTLLGRDPGVALLILFLGLKLMEMRARRDLFVVIFLSFFVLTTTFFYSQSALTAALVALAVVALVAAMLTAQYGEIEAPVGARFKHSAWLFAQAMPLALIMFVLFPRVNGPLWGLPADAHGGITGLSQTMRPGSILDLGASDEVAFRVNFDDETPAPEQMYWRGPVFGHFDGLTWRAARATEQPLSAASVEVVEPVKRIGYTMTLEPNGNRWLLMLEQPDRAPTVSDRDSQITPEFVAITGEPIVARMRYRGHAVTQYRIGANETPAGLQRWLQLPPGYNPRSRAMAEQWRQQLDDPQRLVEQTLSWIRTEKFSYTMTPPPLGEHGVDDFVFNTRAGFCEHYAGAFVVLMRAMGIPARVVTGYQGGQYNPADQYWIIRQADAHAWAEVWLTERGWVRVDPTAAIAPERIMRGARALRPAVAGVGAKIADAQWVQQLRLSLDSLTHSWNQWVLSYNRDRQRQLLAALKLPVDDWLELAVAMAGGLALMIAAFALFTLHPRRPKDPVERCYQSFCDKLADAGIVRAAHETPNRLLARAERLLGDLTLRQQARDIVSRVNALRYDLATLRDSRTLGELKARVDAFHP